MKRSELIPLLKHHEGFRSKPYKCTKGRLTVGYGRNLDDVGLSQQEAEFLLKNDIKNVEDQLSKFDWYNMQPEGVKCALIDMGFMGVKKLLKFKKMIAALREKNYTVASLEALNSQWAKDVGKNRSTNVAVIINQGL